MSSQAAVKTSATSPDLRDGGGLPTGAVNGTAPLSEGPPQSYWARVARDTFRGPGAKLGAAWIGIVALCAVFGPFLASSHPLLLKLDQHWSSPLLWHLTGVDVILMVAFFAAVLLACARRMSFGRKVRWFVVIVVATTPVALGLIKPQRNVVYSIYEEQAAAGRVQYALHAPIPHSPNEHHFRHEFFFVPPGAGHILGTDENGSDVLSRMIHASRIALSIGFISTGIAVIIGVAVGGVMGYFSGRVDMYGMRLLEIFAAIPTLFLLLMFVAVFGRNLYIMMAIIGLTGWVTYARFIRAEFLKLRQQDFVHAAIAAGLPLRSILFRHMLPNGISPVLVNASFGVASAILAESTLSFLGLGLVEDPSWGQLLNQAISVSGFHWWIAIFPGLAIFFTVYAYNLIGEALRDALDPRLRGT
ncbi:MAG: binding-protein-dependent transport system inner rane component [Phycisphaerales bacterium]|nr:binding-protein-dependent transport system inner rane component [Phycisphaerales bacterium]